MKNQLLSSPLVLFAYNVISCSSQGGSLTEIRILNQDVINFESKPYVQ